MDGLDGAVEVLAVHDGGDGVAGGEGADGGTDGGDGAGAVGAGDDGGGGEGPGVLAAGDDEVAIVEGGGGDCCFVCMWGKRLVVRVLFLRFSFDPGYAWFISFLFSWLFLDWVGGSLEDLRLTSTSLGPSSGIGASSISSPSGPVKLRTTQRFVVFGMSSCGAAPFLLPLLPLVPLLLWWPFDVLCR